jgi:hypothetical protein
MMPLSVNPQTHFELFDDFFHVADMWTLVNDGATGTNTLNDAAGGTYSLVTAGADNDYHYLASDAENFLFAANKPLWFEARVRLTEAATNASNIIVGLSDDVSATVLTDNGGGPPANWDGAAFFKVDGGSVWQCETSQETTQTTTTSAAAFTSGSWYRLGIHFDPMDGVNGRVYFLIDGVVVATHRTLLSGMEEMHVILGVKAGGANAETLIVDYVRAIQVR